MKFLFLFAATMASCHVVNTASSTDYQKNGNTCCKIYETSQPIDFSGMKAVLKSNNDNLFDIYTIELTSGKPDLDLTLHLFRNKDGVTIFEQKIGQKPVKSRVINDTSIYSIIKGIDNKYYRQQCYEDASTLLITKLFEVKLQGTVIQTCYLSNGGSDNICDDDKSKILIAHKVSERMRMLANIK